MLIHLESPQMMRKLKCSQYIGGEKCSWADHTFTVDPSATVAELRMQLYLQYVILPWNQKLTFYSWGYNRDRSVELGTNETMENLDWPRSYFLKLTTTKWPRPFDEQLNSCIPRTILTLLEEEHTPAELLKEDFMCYYMVSLLSNLIKNERYWQHIANDQYKTDGPGLYIMVCFALKNESQDALHYLSRIRFRELTVKVTSALHVAGRMLDSLPTAEWLIKNRANINAKDQNGDMPLHIAVENLRLDMVELLCTSKANLDVLNNQGDAPVHIAASKNALDLLQLLHANGANLDMLNSKGETALHIAAKSGDLPTAEWMAKNGANLNAQDTDGNTPLHIAVENLRLDMVKLLCTTKASLDVLNNQGNAPVHIAATKKAVDLLQLLREKGVNLELPSSKGETALHFAAKSGDLPAAEWLVKNGANLNAQDTDCNTPLHTAASKADGSACISALVKAGANIDIKNSRTGETALFVAAANGHLEVVKTLLSLGADPTTRNAKGTSAIDAARKKRQFKIVEVIERQLMKALTNISKMQQELNQLRSQSINFEAERMELEELRAQKTAFAAQQHELDAVRSQFSALQHEMAELREQNTTQLTTMQRSREQEQADHQQLQAVFAAQQQELDELHRENADLQTAAEQTRTGLQSHCEELEQKLERSENLVAAQHREVMALYSERSGWKETAEQTAAEHKQLQKSLQRAETAFFEQQHKLEQVTEQNNELTEQVARLQAEAAQTKAELAAAQSSSTSTIAELQIRLKIAREERDEVTVKNAELMKQIQALESTTSSASATCATCDDLREQLNRCTLVNARQQEAIRQLNEHVADLQDTIERGYY